MSSVMRGVAQELRMSKRTCRALAMAGALGFCGAFWVGVIRAAEQLLQ